jgi:hypothetical protein
MGKILTDPRFCAKTCSGGVLTLVATGSKVNSVKMRWVNAMAA